MGTNLRRRPGTRISLGHSLRAPTNGTSLDNRSLTSRGMADDWKARAVRIGTTGRRSGDELSRNAPAKDGPTRIFAAEAGAVEETRAVENPAPSRRPALLQVIRTLTPTRPPMASQDSICQLCSKPISSGRLVFFEHGELFHLACRSRALRTRSLNVVDAAQTAQTRAASLVAETDRLRRRLVLLARSKSRAGPCPVLR